MKKTLATLCATAIAAPLAVAAAPALAQDATFSIQFGDRDRGWRDDGWRDRDRDWRDRREERRFYNGHRGYRERRTGYVYRDGWWFPPAAFALGAIVGGAIANDPPRRYVPPRANASAHVQWCYDRWRSYRASDNSYQPFNGPRRQCTSPYG